MKQNRRRFLQSGLVTGAAMGLGSMPAIAHFKNGRARKGKMVLRYKPFTLELKHAFGVAVNTRKTTAVVLSEIEYDGIIGYGEASMPPYLGESHESVQKFLSKVDLGRFADPFQMEEILQYVDGIDVNNRAAKACVDIALHDLVGKLMSQPWYKIWGFDASRAPETSFTIGIDTKEVVLEKMKETDPFNVIKVKIGVKESDKMMIETVRSKTNKPLTVDANQGWTDKQYALDMAHYLKEKGALFLEQPMPKEMRDDIAWVTERSPIPIIGDESVQRLPDVRKAYGAYHGINIKLMKCTGMREAHKMLTLARALDMKVMIGCMTETSCAISAAAQLSPMMDWADLDGNLLIKNDIFTGVKVRDGKIVLIDKPGIGISALAH
jgi:L-alanine-DL-glutamate epimerase-like enolase superfamily enzyme